MRIEIEPARADDGHPASDGRPASGGRADPSAGRWTDEEVARLRSEWDAEPGHR